VAGDLNVAHKEIDLHDNRITNISGFTQPEKQSFQKLLDVGMVDTFRLKNPRRKLFSGYSFNDMTKRNLTEGWRLDYVLMSQNSVKYLIDADIHPDIMGSDHAPVSVLLDMKRWSKDVVDDKWNSMNPDQRVEESEEERDRELGSGLEIYDDNGELTYDSEESEGFETIIGKVIPHSII